MALPGFVAVSDINFPFPAGVGHNLLGLTAPTVAPGYLMVAFLWHPVRRNATLDTTDAPLEIPDGWAFLTKIDVGDPQTLAPSVYVYTRRVKFAGDSGEEFFWTVSPNLDWMGVLLTALNAYGVEEVAGNYNIITPNTTETALPVITSRPNQLIYETWVFAPAISPVSVTSSPATNRLSSGDFGIVISEQAQTVAGTTPTQHITTNIAAPWAAVTLSIYPNDAPDAATLLTPADTSTIDVNAAQTFRWQHNDIDPNDTQSAATLQTSDDSGTTWTTQTSGANVNQFWKAPAGTFDDTVSYLWRVRTTDSQGAQGPYSTAGHFTGSTVPSGATITNPTSDEVIGEATVDVTWSPVADGYQVQLWPDNGSGAADTSGTALFDTGQVIDGITGLVTVPLADTGVTRHVQVSIKAAGLWSDFVDRRFAVDYNAPPRPTITLTIGATTITATVTTPLPTGDELAATSVDILLSDDDGDTWWPFALTPKSTGLAPNVIWTYPTPSTGIDYQLRAVAYSDAGTYTYSDPVDAALFDPDVPEVLPPLIPGGGP